MNVIRRTMMEKIENELADDKDSIVRIELTLIEFRRMLRELSNMNGRDNLSKVVIGSKELHFINEISRSRDIPDKLLSGSYVVYKGVCIQTHVDYNK